jgi:hypothetical protein
LKLVEVTLMSWTNFTGWLAVLTVIGIVLASISDANRTDPVGREPFASADGAVNPAIPP